MNHDREIPYQRVPQQSAMLKAVFLKITLVIILRWIELAGRENFGDDGIRPAPALLSLRPGSLSCRFLISREEINGGSILGADVWTLSVESSWVVAVPEYFEQFFQGYGH
ncbi:hypothetical protein SAMN05421881_101454 [Nitrosomonas halophila]|uniref:Uncharacterized protein n=1 Tax=Nitrosomonas halophila TaxID=44576 RepID=A0A1H3GBH2_9PROT|nr:hypothetical protein SAMN05421881_101454 [Nitrosomonas halophila]